MIRSRVYPDDRLVEMEFNDPVRAWAVGCQIVSVNLHDEPAKPTSSISSIVAHGKFADNGCCGYVLKPVCFLNSSVGFGAERTVTIHIISAQNLRRPGVDDVTENASSESDNYTDTETPTDALVCIAPERILEYSPALEGIAICNA